MKSSTQRASNKDDRTSVSKCRMLYILFIPCVLSIVIKVKFKTRLLSLGFHTHDPQHTHTHEQLKNVYRKLFVLYRMTK